MCRRSTRVRKGVKSVPQRIMIVIMSKSPSKSARSTQRQSTTSTLIRATHLVSKRLQCVINDDSQAGGCDIASPLLPLEFLPQEIEVHAGRIRGRRPWRRRRWQRHCFIRRTLESRPAYVSRRRGRREAVGAEWLPQERPAMRLEHRECARTLLEVAFARCTNRFCLNPRINGE